MFISVDFPDPDGPMIDDELPALDLERDALQDVDRHLSQLKVLDQILDRR